MSASKNFSKIYSFYGCCSIRMTLLSKDLINRDEYLTFKIKQGKEIENYIKN